MGRGLAIKSKWLRKGLKLAVLLSELQPTDFREVVALCTSCKTASAAAEGVNLNVNTPADLADLLHSFPSLSLIARDEGKLVGVILCGETGNSGLMHQLAIADSYQNTGLDKEMIDRALEKMKRKGHFKSRISIGSGQKSSGSFWGSQTWEIHPLDSSSDAA